MNLALTEEQELLGDMLLKLFQSESTSARVRAAEPLGFDSALWESLVELQVPLLRVGEAHGGSGLSLHDAVIAADVAGAHLASAPLIEAVVAAQLLEYADNATAADWLNKLASGSAIVTLALRNDVCEQIVPAGAIADAVLFLDGDAIYLQPQTRSQGAKNSGSLPLALLPFDATQALLLVRGEGVSARYCAAIEEWKILSSAFVCGLARRAVENAADYSRERVAFGKPIGTFQGISHPLADAITEVEGGRLLVWRTVWAIATQQRDAAAMVPMTFWWTAQAATSATIQAMRTFGGYGMSMEYDAQLFFRRARALALLLGDPASSLLSAGDRLWGGEIASMPVVGATTLDFSFGPDAEKLEARASEFMVANMTPAMKKAIFETEDGVFPEFQHALGAAGLLYRDWPAEYGGEGCSASAAAGLRRKLAAYEWPTLPATVADMIGKMLMDFGSASAKSEILPRIASGEAVCCLGYSEPSGGSDVFAAKTRAVRDGDDWIINGQKMFTTMAHCSQYCLLIARTGAATPKHAGLTLFVAPLDLAGFECHGVDTIGHERTNITYFTDMRLPDRYRLGEVDGGAKVMAAALKLEHGAGDLYVSALDHLLNYAVAWARSAKIDGAPALDSADVRRRLARLATETAVSDALTKRSLWAGDAGVYRKEYGPMSKLFGSEAWMRGSMDIVELAAPDSLIQEHTALGWIDLLNRQSIPGTIYSGTSEIQRSMIAESALGMPRSRG